MKEGREKDVGTKNVHQSAAPFFPFLEGGGLGSEEEIKIQNRKKECNSCLLKHKHIYPQAQGSPVPINSKIHNKSLFVALKIKKCGERTMNEEIYQTVFHHL